MFMFLHLKRKISFKCLISINWTLLNFHVMLLWKIMIPYYQISISCFLEDIDPVFKIIQKWISRIFRAPSFPFVSTVSISQILRLPENIFVEIDSVFSRVIWSLLVSPKRNHIGFGSRGHVQKSEHHENDGFSGFPKMKSKSY